MGKPYAVAAIITMVIGSGYILYTSDLFQKQKALQSTEIIGSSSSSSSVVAEEPVVTAKPDVTPVKAVTTEESYKEYKNTELGFSVLFPAVYGVVTQKKRLGLLLENGKTISAPDELVYAKFNYFVPGGVGLGDRYMFTVEGKDFMTFSDGIPVQKILTTCKTGIDPDTNKKSTYPCSDKINANGTHYYYIDSYSAIIGQSHMALFPLSNGSVILFTQLRVDSDEVAGTPADVAVFNKMIASVTLLN
jgi:hypothetical protein